MSTPLSRRWVAKLWRRTCTLTRLSMPAAARAERQAACRTVGSIGFCLSRPGNKKSLGMREPPIAAQDAEQLLGQHDVALLAALAAFDPDDHAAAVDVGRLQADHLRHPQPRSVGGGQRDTRLEARDGFEKAHDFVGAQNGRQLARFAGIGDPLRDRIAAERHTVEETQRADDLIERRPGDALRDQMHLVGADVLQPEPIRRMAEISAEHRNRVDVGSLGRRRKIADRHVFRHPPAQRAHLGHLKSPV